MRTLLPQSHQHGDCHDHEGYLFFCPACKHGHVYTIKCSYPGPRWTFNGNMEKPSFQASLLHTTPFKTEDGGPEICHLFVTDGMIQFCGDCTHDLAGKTVPLPDLNATQEQE